MQKMDHFEGGRGARDTLGLARPLRLISGSGVMVCKAHRPPMIQERLLMRCPTFPVRPLIAESSLRPQQLHLLQSYRLPCRELLRLLESLSRPPNSCYQIDANET